MSVVPVPEGKKIRTIQFKANKCKSSLLCYSTFHCGFFKKIGRGLIRWWTNSQFEHIGTVCKMHEGFHGEHWISRYDNTDLVEIEKSVYYSVEATQKDGVVIMPLLKRFLKPSLLEQNWWGSIYMRKFKSLNTQKHKEVTQYIKDINASKDQYQLIAAIASVFKRWLRVFISKVFRVKYTPQADCSILAISLANVNFDLGLTPNEMLSFTPQKTIDFLFKKGYTEHNELILEYQDGKIVAYNEDIFNVTFE